MKQNHNHALTIPPQKIPELNQPSHIIPRAYEPTILFIHPIQSSISGIPLLLKLLQLLLEGFMRYDERKLLVHYQETR